jgi:broad specificity phosphatase PhoE
MKLYFARHGESEANILHVISNRTLPHHLTATGRTQAAALAEQLTSAGISMIFTSPVLRAVQTTEILVTTLGLTYTVTDALREYDCGILEGKSDEESWRLHRKLAEDWVIRKNWQRKIEGGESFLDIRNRFVPFIAQVTHEPAYANRNILLLGHGGTFRMMLPLILTNIETAFVETHPIHHTTCIIAEQGINGLYCLQWGEISLV